PSSPALATHSPPGDRARAATALRWPGGAGARVPAAAPVAGSDSPIGPKPPVASSLPSGANTAVVHGTAGVPRRSSSLPAATSHVATVCPSSTAALVKSGENVTAQAFGP